MDLITYLIVFVVGLALGLWGYRYALKRDPAKLEALAQKAKALRE